MFISNCLILFVFFSISFLPKLLIVKFSLSFRIYSIHLLNVSTCCIFNSTIDVLLI
nr:MAG TPA: hypothetical protein [Caudoviricetes sp.]